MAGGDTEENFVSLVKKRRQKKCLSQSRLKSARLWNPLGTVHFKSQGGKQNGPSNSMKQYRYLRQKTTFYWRVKRETKN